MLSDKRARKNTTRQPVNPSVLQLLERRARFCGDLDGCHGRVGGGDVDGDCPATRPAAGGLRREVLGSSGQATGEGLDEAASVHGHEEGVDEGVGHGVEVGEEHADLLQRGKAVGKSDVVPERRES